jgi:DNA-binding NtrC family response regulator
MKRTHRVLIVEDEPNVRLVFTTALASDENALATAVDGETALSCLKKDPADLVLLDLNMPGMGGMEFLRRLREAGDNVPVVIVSAHDGAPNVVQAMRLGAIDFLPKPLPPDTLRKVVAEVLARRGQRPAQAAATPTSKPAEPQNASDKDLMIQSKDALNRRDFSVAETLLKTAVRRVPLAAEAHYLIGILHELRDEKDAAYRSYRASVQANPNFEPAKLHLMKYFNDRLM